jgi:hypothetical protein
MTNISKREFELSKGRVVIYGAISFHMIEFRTTESTDITRG